MVDGHQEVIHLHTQLLALIHEILLIVHVVRLQQADGVALREGDKAPSIETGAVYKWY